VKAALDLMPITASKSKPQRRFAPNDLIGFLRKTDRHQIGMVIGIVGIASGGKNGCTAGLTVLFSR
jgi:hypothetical protein